MTIKTTWDYTDLADAYVLRPDYSKGAVAEIAERARSAGNRACDVGAGTAHLTRLLAAEGFEVDAVEPNDAMRANGIRITGELEGVSWSEGVGEATGRPDDTYALVSFGSSFNVCDRTLALAEAHRILVPNGVFACIWNHRNLEDPLQAEIEAAIHAALPDYGYGVRRQDQTEILEASPLFDDVTPIEGRLIHVQGAEDCIEAWRSHATLQRQAGDRFASIVETIAEIVHGQGDAVEIPYTTRGWMATANG